ncbi:MAG: hypothetical protein PUG76_01520 [Prevotellaceae bacterium]|nr:hypothetical protein [Prevotellaceae bacterium]
MKKTYITPVLCVADVELSGSIMEMPASVTVKESVTTPVVDGGFANESIWGDSDNFWKID